MTGDLLKATQLVRDRARTQASSALTPLQTETHPLHLSS